MGIFNRIHDNKVYKADDPGLLFLYYFLAPLLNIAARDDLVIEMKEVGFTDALKEFLSKEDPNIWMQVLTLLAALVTEEECDVILSNKERVEELLNLLAKGLKESELRVRGWSCPRAVAHTIRLLARNDANKRMLVELGAFQLLCKLGKVNGKEEQMESLQSIWLLCFDEKNKKEAVDNEKIGIVDLLLELQGDTDKDIARASRKALWTIRDELSKSKNRRYRRTGEKYKLSATQYQTHTTGKDRSKPRAELTAETDDCKNKYTTKVQHGSIYNTKSILNYAKAKKHIMISYNKTHREVLLKIKERISRRGYSVWMDVDNMSGSTLDSMARAVEDAEIVLICMSQMYKDSNNCHAEAEYAFALKKKIIPLYMERNYKPDGWLAILCGTKLYFDFSGKYDYEDKLKELLKEIERQFPGSSKPQAVKRRQQFALSARF
ncbi:uncharacterized protein LOC128240906 isoform X2 [Mya arenaria]|uniref:uncharacterized protein LOC128240906 isoform X2 n=1 Tax=Mya arenaria TaxID=6604 RepID=UPI0022DEF4F4|nr:uncharacterized protein LOC128240906 isoform X2 [Mya arenaria]